MQGCKNRRVGIKEIADKAGVSPTTVSNIAHGKTQRISDKTVRKVKRLLEENNYVPNMGTRLISGKSSGVIGLIMKKNTNNAEADMAAFRWIRKLEEEIYKYSYHMLLHFSDSEEEILRLANMWNMEGIILAGYDKRAVQIIDEEFGRPVLNANMYGRFEREYHAGEMMGSFLIGAGYTSICYMEQNDDHAYWNGLKEMLKRSGICTENMEYLHIPLRNEERVVFYKRNLGRAAFSRKLLVFSEENYAVEALGYLTDMGIRVPDEAAVAGFGADLFARFARPQMTIVKVSPEPNARILVESLFQMIHKIPVKYDEEKGELLIRDSVKVL